VSEENVQLVRAIVDLVNGRKLRSEDRPWEQLAQHEAVIALIGADTVFVDNVLLDHPGEEFRGRDRVVGAAERWIEDCEWLRLELLEIIDADEHVVSIHTAHMKMRDTGLEFESPLAYVYTFRESECVRIQSFVDVGEALKAAGLEA
jgi:ketosteroid isomerase-like protein